MLKRIKSFFFGGLEKQLSTFIYQDLSAVLPPISAAVVIFGGIKLHGPLLALINNLQTCTAVVAVYFGLRFSPSDKWRKCGFTRISAPLFFMSWLDQNKLSYKALVLGGLGCKKHWISTEPAWTFVVFCFFLFSAKYPLSTCCRLWTEWTVKLAWICVFPVCAFVTDGIIAFQTHLFLLERS